MKTDLPLVYIEISRKNLIHNIKALKSLAKKRTQFAVAIKSNAYGHGQNQIAEILEPYVDYFQVNSLAELELLRKTSKKKALLLGYVQYADLAKVIKLNCILAVFSLDTLRALGNITDKTKRAQEIHIAFDAYLGREGVLLADLPQILQEIKKYKYIKLTGIYAHFANIEDITNFTHAQKQINEYNKALKIAGEYGFANLTTHISATSGLMVYEKGDGINPLIRLGLGVYGLWPSEYLKTIKTKSKFILKPVLSYKSKIAQIKVLPVGHTIGYGLTYKTTKETKVAIIPQGYADGVDRGLSNLGQVLIAGTRCPILGRVMMNMFVVDVSHLPKVKIEDEIVIIGVQGRESITAEEIANKLDTINYEVITRISSLLLRIVV